MNEQLDLTQEVDFTYPEGFQQAAAALDFLPEEERESFLALMVQIGLQM